MRTFLLSLTVSLEIWKTFAVGVVGILWDIFGVHVFAADTFLHKYGIQIPNVFVAGQFTFLELNKNASLEIKWHAYATKMERINFTMADIATGKFFSK